MDEEYSANNDRFQPIARTEEIPEGEGRAFELGDRVIAVFHVGGQFHAIDDACPHMGVSLSSGCVNEHIVTCPWHGWRFDVTDGTWCDSPRVKTRSYRLKIEAGQILVAIEPGDDTPEASDDDSEAPPSQS